MVIFYHLNNMSKLYKRNSTGKPMFWSITNMDSYLYVEFGIVGTEGRGERITIKDQTKVSSQIKSMIESKRKEGYKYIEDLYDNANSTEIVKSSLYTYLDTYLPKNNTHSDGNIIPMLSKTLEDNKPFMKSNYFGGWKLDGERCIVSAHRRQDLFSPIYLKYHSREGTDWTDKLSFMDNIIIPKLGNLLDMMVEEGVCLDGEMYLPGESLKVSDINSIIKNITHPLHYKLQYWVFDLASENDGAMYRQAILNDAIGKYIPKINTKEDHYNITSQFNLVQIYLTNSFDETREYRDKFVQLGFEGIVIRANTALYQFGGKRNSAMFKYKPKYDGKFLIVDIIPEGIKRSNLPKFVLKNDINDEYFEVTINKPQSVQEEIFANKDNYLGKLMFVEYRDRSGEQNKNVPTHAKGINIVEL